jgi:hypothetical protein
MPDNRSGQDARQVKVRSPLVVEGASVAVLGPVRLAARDAPSGLR